MLHRQSALLNGVLIAALSSALFVPLPARASRARQEKAQETTAAPPLMESKGTVAICPIIFDKSGTSGSRQSAEMAIRQDLQTMGYTLISDTVAASNWNRLGLSVPADAYPAHVEDLVRFGNTVHADYVVSAKFHFHSRSIWVDIGPKTVSTVTVDMVVIDVSQNKLVYSKLGASGRSDARGKMIDLAPLATLSPPIQTMVSGGPKTPHEQRAAEIAVASALHDWLLPVQTSDSRGPR
jgi:hypothetical protein